VGGHRASAGLPNGIAEIRYLRLGGTAQWMMMRGENIANPPYRSNREEPMSDKSQRISDAFQLFLKESPQHARVWMSAVHGLGKASALDEKTNALAYLAVLAALRLESGVPFHVAHAKEVGASRNEVISAVLIGLPAAGTAVTHVLPGALQAYDET
jgi:alkylhydroperoxidase/carboxymuconolactone decarboxylase family protein YurZ